MIPTWKNIGGLSLDLSQRATQAAGNEAQQALAGLQDMAAQQRQFNVKAEDATTQENLLKFQQAARNMSLGELDALGKAAPEVLMDRFGLNQKNIGQAVDFANKQDDAVRAQELEMYQYQENQRKQAEAPVRAAGSTLLAEAEATGNFDKFNAFMKSEAGKLQDSSDLYAGMNDAKNRLLQKERSEIQFNQNQQDRNRMLSKIKAEEGFNALTGETLVALAASSDPETAAKGITKTLDYIRKNPSIDAGNAIQTLNTLNEAAEKLVAPNTEQAAQINATKFSGETAIKAKEAEVERRLAEAQRNFPVDARMRPIMEEAEKGLSPETVLDKFIKDTLPENVNFQTASDTGGQELKRYLPSIREAYRKEFNQELPGKLLEVALTSMETSGDWWLGDKGIDTNALNNKVKELGQLYKDSQANFKTLAAKELDLQNELNNTRLEQATKLGQVMSGARKMNKEEIMMQLRLRGNVPFSEIQSKPTIR